MTESSPKVRRFGRTLRRLYFRPVTKPKTTMTKDEIIKEVKRLRGLGSDFVAGVRQLINSANESEADDLPLGDFIQCASTARLRGQESVMWLGMALAALDVPTPYPNSKDPSNTKIDPTAPEVVAMMGHQDPQGPVGNQGPTGAGPVTDSPRLSGKSTGPNGEELDGE